MKSFSVFAGAALVLAMAATANAVAFTAYNDCLWAWGDMPANGTCYWGTMVSSQTNPQVTSGLLKDWDTGAWTGVTATMSAVNIDRGAAPDVGQEIQPGTDAYNVFNGKVSYLGDGAAAYYADAAWSYQVAFSGLDPAKTYEFATTANRGKTGGYTPTRNTLFQIVGADTYTNASTLGVTVITPDAVKFDTGNQGALGYVARWTGITAADGTFSVVSQNVPGEQNKGYGMEVFMLREVPEPGTIVLLLIALVGTLAYAWKNRK